ncbi:hypothetical protein C0583_02315 [Candidatus Parcubacteria bacterium]|nr:MAG: hypothetical protein C0583_02315 [Candidatus Parcubacteria bacterium]
MINIPKNLENIVKKLENAGFEAFLVGGCVRDYLRNVEPKDWDITTNARPEEILKVLPEGKYENDFGTVIYPVKNKDAEVDDVYEITTYRSEQGYSDSRHPDEVKFEKELDKDLERRDFTVNAMAMNINNQNIVDLFGGQKDIEKEIIRAVGEPENRFKEDALRLMRAVRFHAELGYTIEEKTERATKKLAGSIKFVAKERIKDELVRILKSDKPYEGFLKLYRLNLLNYIIPELLEGDGVKQNHHHIYAVLKHNFLSLKNCPSKEWQVRLAALLHDVGKPRTYKIINNQVTFYNHEYVSEKLTRKIMKRLKFSTKDSDRVTNLVRNHMFYYNTGEVTASSVRRLIKKVGKDNLKDLIDVRIADRLGSNTPKGKPYKLKHLEYMFERVQNDPVNVGMLELNGDEMIKNLGFEPGPKMGAVLDCLLAEVIEEPKLNTKEYLSKKALELNKEDIEQLREKAKDKIEEKREEEDRKMRRGYKVK